jgi:hypothetical protein
MDPVTVSYYAAVCGLLSAFTPRQGSYVLRLILGAVVGIVAAGLLPWLRGHLG